LQDEDEYDVGGKLVLNDIGGQSSTVFELYKHIMAKMSQEDEHTYYW
jgi:hypothetical protein